MANWTNYEHQKAHPYIDEYVDWMNKNLQHYHPALIKSAMMGIGSGSGEGDFHFMTLVCEQKGALPKNWATIPVKSPISVVTKSYKSFGDVPEDIDHYLFKNKEICSQLLVTESRGVSSESILMIEAESAIGRAAPSATPNKRPVWKYKQWQHDSRWLYPSQVTDAMQSMGTAFSFFSLKTAACSYLYHHYGYKDGTLLDLFYTDSIPNTTVTITNDKTLNQETYAAIPWWNHAGPWKWKYKTYTDAEAVTKDLNDESSFTEEQVFLSSITSYQRYWESRGSESGWKGQAYAIIYPEKP